MTVQGSCAVYFSCTTCTTPYTTLSCIWVNSYSTRAGYLAGIFIPDIRPDPTIYRISGKCNEYQFQSCPLNWEYNGSIQLVRIPAPEWRAGSGSSAPGAFAADSPSPDGRKAVVMSCSWSVKCKFCNIVPRREGRGPETITIVEWFIKQLKANTISWQVTSM